MNSFMPMLVRVAQSLRMRWSSGFSRQIPLLRRSVGFGLLLLSASWPAVAHAGSMFYDSWAGEVGKGPDSAWGVENLSDPNNGKVHYTNVTPSQSSASNPTTLQVISDSTSPTGRALQLTIQPSPGFATNGGVYDSAEVSTKLSGVIENNVEYGHIEACIKVAGGPGTGADSVWPAFWMLGDNINSVGWPKCGEIDIMETKGSAETTNGGHLHGPLSSGGDYNGGSGVGGDYTLPNGEEMYAGYHTYAIDWSPNSITWSVDGVDFLTETPTSSNFPSNGTWVFNNHPFYLIFDVCQGGPFAGTGHNITAPLSMDIAYVEVTASNTGSSNASSSGSSTPEPGSAALLAVAAAFGLAVCGWRRRKKTRD
jgi:beta-glucanase (GH16 family)